MVNKKIVEKILKLIPEINIYYKKWVGVFSEEDIDLSKKLSSLSLALISFTKREYFNPKIWCTCLENIEKYLETCSIEETGVVEIFFFEGIMNWLLAIQEDNKQKDYSEKIRSCLGPKSLKVCQQNDEFWGTNTPSMY